MRFMILAAGFGVVCLSSWIATAGEPAKKEKAKTPVEARLIVSDPGELFSSDAIKKAKASMAEVKDRFSREMSIITYKELPEDRKKAYDKLDKEDKTARNRFFRDWAIEEAKGDRARGVFVLICRSPGQVHILADSAIRAKGFTIRDEEQVRDLLVARFREAKEAKEKNKSDEEQTTIRDKGLLAAVDFVKDAYKKMSR